MENKAKKIRKASHAGSWYSEDKTTLEESLNKWLTAANGQKNIKQVKAIIGPHAGYDYSGSTAAWAYININPFNYNRVFLLGPCHHKHINGCGLPSCTEYETPIGNIKVDTDIVEKLNKLDNFERVSKRDEEDEHSLEMHLPYIKKMFGENEFKLVPIMVGSINPKLEEYFGKVLSEYINDEKNLFIISSDFCHWGKNFDYLEYDASDGQIYQSIEKLDKRGIECIVNQDPYSFINYLKETDNTICGRHPITVFLFALKNSELYKDTKTTLLHYKQSSQVKTMKGSSVSYASIATFIENN